MLDKDIKFSVLIPLHKQIDSSHFNSAIESIWDNQSLKPNQIVLVCDGELTLDLYQVINTWKLKLNNILHIHQFNKNVGLTMALNEGLKYCKYDYVARMDSDDISSPQRFTKQLNFLSKNPNTTLVGSNVLEFMYNINNIIFRKNVPSDYNAIATYIKYRNPVNHMSVIFKKKDILKVGGYTDLNGYEDYLLWVKLFINGFNICNLNENLVFARIDNGFILRRKGYILFKNEIILQFKFYKLGLFGINTFLHNLIFRSISRLLPISILKFIYKKLRNE